MCRTWLSIFTAVLCLSFLAEAWDSSELEMFDLVEELKMSFYDVMGIKSDASLSEIKRAYRRLSLELHPDRNMDDPEADKKFRQLATIYQVLKTKELRESYDDILVNGLPDWRTPVFYYRTLRKMSNLELTLLISCIFISVHFAAMWGHVFEQRWTLRDRLESQLKRHKASDKRKIAIDLEISMNLKAIQSPTFWDILPFAIVKGVCSCIAYIPTYIRGLNRVVSQNVKQILEKKKKKKELEKEEEKRREKKLLKKQQQCMRSGKVDDEEADFAGTSLFNLENLRPVGSEMDDNDVILANIDKEWTANEELLLIRLTNKYPGGFPNRWKKISELMGRSVNDITSKASAIAGTLSERMQINPEKVTDSELEEEEEEEESDDYCYVSKRKAKRAVKVGKQRIAVNFESTTNWEKCETLDVDMDKEEVMGEDDAPARNESDEDTGHISRKKRKQIKTKVQSTLEENHISVPDAWTQKEQNQLETAIKTIPKGVPERWQRIAECLPTKTLPEITARVKFLSETSKQKHKSAEYFES